MWSQVNMDRDYGCSVVSCRVIVMFETLLTYFQYISTNIGMRTDRDKRWALSIRSVVPIIFIHILT